MTWRSLTGLPFLLALILLPALVGCREAPPPEPGGERVPGSGGQAAGRRTPAPDSQVVQVYFVCGDTPPGGLSALPRTTPPALPPVEAAIGELVRGPTVEEQARGCRSFFSSRTAGMLRSVHRSSGGDTITVDFTDWSSAIPDQPGARSFLPPGVMAELTWTLFQQFPELRAVRFAFAGDESAFWSWVAGEKVEPRVYTRGDWERI